MSNNVVYFPRKKISQSGDDYRERMRANFAAIAFITIFLFGSCWVIDTLLSNAARTDCNFSVRRPCHMTFDANSASLGRGVATFKMKEAAN